MKRIYPWFAVPLGMAACCFAIVCATGGVDLSISRQGEAVRIGATNNTFRCFMFQWNSSLDTNSWNDYHGYFCGAGEAPCPRVGFTIKADNQHAFWRAEERPEP